MTMEHGEDCCVRVAVHVRPLIGDEKLQGCKDCVAVVPGKPQVRIGLQILGCFFAARDGWILLSCLRVPYLSGMHDPNSDWIALPVCSFAFFFFGPLPWCYVFAMHGSIQTLD